MHHFSFLLCGLNQCFDLQLYLRIEKKERLMNFKNGIQLNVQRCLCLLLITSQAVSQLLFMSHLYLLHRLSSSHNFNWNFGLWDVNWYKATWIIGPILWSFSFSLRTHVWWFSYRGSNVRAPKPEHTSLLCTDQLRGSSAGCSHDSEVSLRCDPKEEALEAFLSFHLNDLPAEAPVSTIVNTPSWGLRWHLISWMPSHGRSRAHKVDHCGILFTQGTQHFRLCPRTQITQERESYWCLGPTQWDSGVVGLENGPGLGLWKLPTWL